MIFTHHDLATGDDGSAEWLWVFDPPNQRLFVRNLTHKVDLPPIDLVGPEPDWAVLECGEIDSIEGSSIESQDDVGASLEKRVSELQFLQASRTRAAGAHIRWGDSGSAGEPTGTARSELRSMEKD
jgi:hypothetical protein